MINIFYAKIGNTILSLWFPKFGDENDIIEVDISKFVLGATFVGEYWQSSAIEPSAVLFV